jgi:hypothetical protein
MKKDADPGEISVLGKPRAPGREACSDGVIGNVVSYAAGIHLPET